MGRTSPEARTHLINTQSLLPRASLQKRSTSKYATKRHLCSARQVDLISSLPIYEIASTSTSCNWTTIEILGLVQWPLARRRGSVCLKQAVATGESAQGREDILRWRPQPLQAGCAGKSIPTRGNAFYDGSVAAYFYTSAFGGLGPGFFTGVDVPFNLARAKKWARETRSGVLIGRSYRNNSLAGQGHVAILLPDSKVLQSFQFGADGEPGLNADYTIEESHAGGYYEIMGHPKDWINHDKGKKFAPDEVEEQKAGGRRDEKGRRDGTDDEPYEPVEEFTDEEFEEIGREILKLFSRLRQDRTRRRR